MIHGPHRLSAALALAFALPAEEREQMERVKVMTTEPIEVRDMRYEFNLPLKELCGPIPDLSGTYKAEATMTIAAHDRHLQGVRQTMTPPQTKPRSKRGQRGRKWK